MELSEFVNLFVNNSLSVCLVAFYLLKDWKFNNQLVESLKEISENLKKGD